MSNKKAFTLLEIIIVVGIIGVLAGVLFKTYITISQISFKVEQQKIVSQEFLFMSQIIQNFSDEFKIDYSKYDNQDLVQNKGIVDILYMTGGGAEISLFSSGDCNDISSGDVRLGCNLYLEKEDKVIQMNKNNVSLSKSLFKVIPFSDDYINDPSLCESNYLSCINDSGFWWMANIYGNGYDSRKWTNNATIKVSQFFNN